jgi:hypothetical protein
MTFQPFAQAIMKITKMVNLKLNNYSRFRKHNLGYKPDAN